MVHQLGGSEYGDVVCTVKISQGLITALDANATSVGHSVHKVVNDPVEETVARTHPCFTSVSTGTPSDRENSRRTDDRVSE